MSMVIKPVDQTVKNLLEAGFYRIPGFQRPYSWDAANVEDFWNDTILGEDIQYFIGSFVLYTDKQQDDLFYVVDGQQRLTTITLLLAALRNGLHTQGFGELAKGVQSLIEKEDLNHEKQFILQSESSYPYLHEHIQKFGSPETEVELGTEENALKQAYDYLVKQIGLAVQAVDTDSTVSDKKKPEAKRKKLLDIRNRVLRLQLISIRMGNEDDAYLIFETLNTRGKDLAVSDLVKNQLFRYLRQNNKHVNIAKDKWNSIRERFDDPDEKINLNRFLHHFWLSRKDFTSERKLFKDVRHVVTSKEKATEFLNQLEADSKIYRFIMEPDSRKWTKQEIGISSSLDALGLFKIAQPIPMMLSIMREYAEKRISLKQVRQIMVTLENFHLQFTAITAQRTGGGTALMYATPAKQLLAAKDANEKARVLTDFEKKLKERIPAYVAFEGGFSSVRYTKDNTKQRGLVNYLFRRIEGMRRSQEGLDLRNYTLEHIGPQNPPAGAATVSDELIGTMGNMIFVPEELNAALENKDFPTKKKILTDAGFPLDEVLTNATVWTDAEVVARTKWLAKYAYDTVFKI